MQIDKFESNYLLENIESVNSKFIIEPLWDPLSEDINLPKSKEVIINAWKITEMESPDGEDFEIFPVRITSCNSKIHQKRFDFFQLEETLNINIFKEEIANSILEEEDLFKEELNVNFLNAKTDFQINHLLKEYIGLINNVSNNLNSLEVNKIQKVVISLYQKSYQRVLEHLKNEFQRVYPNLFTTELRIDNNVHDDDLKSIFFPDEIKKFKEIERKLLKGDFLKKNENGKLQWNQSYGFKVKLVNFCRVLENRKLTIPNVKTSKIIKILEERYNFDAGDQYKTSKHGKLNLAEADFYLLFN